MWVGPHLAQGSPPWGPRAKMREQALGGAMVSLDDLMGYSKLQDVLALIMAHLSGHDATIQQAEAAARSAQRMIEEVSTRSQSLEEKMAAAEEWAKTAEAAAASIMRLQAQQEASDQAMQASAEALEQCTKDARRSAQDLTARVDAAERSVATTDRAVAALQPQLAKDLAGVAEGLGAQLGAAEGRLAALESLVAAQETPDLGPLQKLSEAARVRIDTIEGRMRELAARVANAEKLADRPEPPPGVDEEALRELEAALQERLAALRASLGSRLLEAEQQIHELHERVAAGAADKEAALLAEQERAKLEALLSKLHSEVVSMRDATGRELKVLGDQEVTDTMRLSREVRELHAYITASMSTKNASATSARCLCCSDSRSQKTVKTIVGADGKVYRQTPAAEDVGEPSWLDGPKTSHGKLSLQGGSGSAMRKFKTWTGEQRLRPGSSSTPLLPGLDGLSGRNAVISLLRHQMTSPGAVQSP